MVTRAEADASACGTLPKMRTSLTSKLEKRQSRFIYREQRTEVTIATSIAKCPQAKLYAH